MPQLPVVGEKIGRRSVLGLLGATLAGGVLWRGAAEAPSENEPEQGSPGSIMGGGNLVNDETSLTERRASICRQFGCGVARLTVFPPYYYSDYRGETLEDKITDNVLQMYRAGIEPTILFEYYDKYKNPLGKREKWYQIGKAFAEKYRPGSDFLRNKGIQNWGIRQYTAINEPGIRNRIAKWRYRNALEGLANGVHEVDDSLEVYPGGWASPSAHADYTRNGYVPAVADLIDRGVLDGFCLHIYFDTEHAPMDGTYKHSAQANFDRVKEIMGISSDPNFYCDEFNYVARKVSQEQAAKHFLTAIWDVLGVVGDDGSSSATRIALPWTPFHTVADDPEFGLIKNADPFEPSPRGDVLALVLELTANLKMTERHPKDGGEFELTGPDASMRVWQNRAGWTDDPRAEYRLTSLPSDATRLSVIDYDGLRQSRSLNGQEACTVTGLTPGETYMFLLT